MSLPHPMDDKTGFEATDEEMGLGRRDRQFLNFTRGLVQPAAVDMAPLEQLEAKARAIWPSGAETGPLYVLHRPAVHSAHQGGFIYQWGDAEISRTEAARRASGRAT
jgi:hypothetical protein